ncbi:MAG: pyruvate carboxyltransferase [Bacteroidetes bacterium]|nr:pyruvate carboxyltransferase [Bacteroidota bacterium]
MRPILLDTTLRDGEQSPGVYFTNKEKLHIASCLDRLGIAIIEAGIPSMGEEELKNLRALQGLGLKAEIMTWNRLLESDVIASLQSGVKSVHLSSPTSDILLKAKMRQSREWLKPQMEKIFALASSHGLDISFGAEDSSRTDPLFLQEIFLTAQQLGAKRVRIADTLGILTPAQVARLVSFLKETICIPIDFHGHNDFGLASANALAAWENGAEIISCSVLGLGERAGNTSLEEFAGIVHYLKGGLNDFDFVALKDLCESVARLTASPLPDRKPIFGEKVYTHESGIHVDGILKNPETYEFYNPEQIGRNRKLVVGKHSGRKAIHHLAKTEGYDLSDELIDDFLKEMRHRMSLSRNVDAAKLFKTYLSHHALNKLL